MRYAILSSKDSQLPQASAVDELFLKTKIFLNKKKNKVKIFKQS